MYIQFDFVRTKQSGERDLVPAVAGSLFAFFRSRAIEN